ncbi:MAG: GntR family transcriptional regulator [Candidatus Falkowbacteria bacterium]|nr:GntR family transcriptional regulator [Candidatus Falkowbacteria bacterium]
MDIYKVKWTRLQIEIFRFLCIKAGQRLNLRAIARALKVSPTAVSNSLGLLKKEGLVKIKKSHPYNLFSIEFNRDSSKAIELKRVENLRLIYESGLFEVLFNAFPGCTITLFGSYSKGEDVWITENNQSDIDIAVIGSKSKDVDLSRFEKFLERKININYYDSWQAIHKHLKNNILNGILLNGSVEL